MLAWMGTAMQSKIGCDTVLPKGTVPPKERSHTWKFVQGHLRRKTFTFFHTVFIPTSLPEWAETLKKFSEQHSAPQPKPRNYRCDGCEITKGSFRGELNVRVTPLHKADRRAILHGWEIIAAVYVICRRLCTCFWFIYVCLTTHHAAKLEAMMTR